MNKVVTDLGLDSSTENDYGICPVKSCSTTEEKKSLINPFFNRQRNLSLKICVTLKHGKIKKLEIDEHQRRKKLGVSISRSPKKDLDSMYSEEDFNKMY